MPEIVAGVALLVVLLWILFPHTGYSRGDLVWRELNLLRQYVNMTYFDTPDDIPDDLQTLMDRWNTPPERNPALNRDYCPQLMAGLDEWGSPFVYNLDRDAGTLEIYSLGVNRKDEGGEGDDIAVACWFTDEALDRASEEIKRKSRLDWHHDSSGH